MEAFPAVDNSDNDDDGSDDRESRHKKTESDFEVLTVLEWMPTDELGGLESLAEPLQPLTTSDIGFSSSFEAPVELLKIEPELRDRDARHKDLSFGALFEHFASILTEIGS